MPFNAQKSLILMKSSSSTCLLLSVLFGVISTKAFQIQYHEDFSSSIFKMFTVLAPKPRSLTHFQLIFTYGMRLREAFNISLFRAQIARHCPSIFVVKTILYNDLHSIYVKN